MSATGPRLRCLPARGLRAFCLVSALAAAACGTKASRPARSETVTAFRCGAEQAPTPKTAREARLLAAIQRAIGFFEQNREPFALLMLDVMRRRFDIRSFDDALTRYDQLLAQDSPRLPILRVFRRIADHDNVLLPGDAGVISTGVDQLTVPALYCDRMPLPNNYVDLLEQANGSGAYLRTHALLSLQWLRENACAVRTSPTYESALIDAIAKLIVVDGAASDLELEAAGFLYSYGRGDAVSTAFVDEAIAQQNQDGGWLVGNDERPGSDWHASITGIYLLLHAYCGARDYPPMLAPPRPASNAAPR